MFIIIENVRNFRSWRETLNFIKRNVNNVRSMYFKVINQTRSCQGNTYNVLPLFRKCNGRFTLHVHI